MRRCSIVFLKLVLLTSASRGYVNEQHLCLLQKHVELITVGRSNTSHVKNQARRDSGAASEKQLAVVTSKATPSVPLLDALQVDRKSRTTAKAFLHHMLTMLRTRGDYDPIIIIVVAILALLIFTMFCTYWRATHVLGNGIAAAIEAYDKDYLGVDLSFGDVGFNPFSGEFTINGFLVDNVEGYSSKYIMQAKYVKIDIDMWLYVATCGHYITVEEIAIHGANIIYEKSLGSSNVDQLIKYMKEGEDLHDAISPDGVDEEHAPMSQGCAARMLSCAGNIKDKAQRRIQAVRNFKRKLNDDPSSQRVKIQRVIIKDCGVRLEAKGLPGHGVQLAIANMNFPDLQRKVGRSYPKMVSFVLRQVMASAAKTAQHNLLKMAHLTT